jgi:WD40 repeat protein
VQRLETDTDSPYCLSFSPDGKFLAVGCQEGAVRLYCMATGKQLFRHQSELSVFDIVWSRTADKVAYTTGGKKLGVLHIKRT